ncbi:TetR/AcrR family transcriptional regulator, partial [Myxococcota bacterium]|nr:TetR/AcrR family transcriptional regulator [Myxococcota bacterium]
MIARAATKLFLTEGYERTSMRRIAEAIDYTPGALYSYFEDKDEILLVIHNEAFDRLHATLSEAERVADPYEALVRCGELYLSFALENPQLYDLMFIMDATGNHILETKDWRPGLRSYDLLRRRVYAAMAAGALPDGNPEAVSFAMWASVHGLAALVIRNRCPMVAPEALPGMVRAAFMALMDGLERGARAERGGAGVMLPPFVALADVGASPLGFLGHSLSSDL